MTLARAALTGTFCAVFTVGVDLVTNVLSMATLIGLSFVSGFLGSLFAQVVLKRKDRK